MEHRLKCWPEFFAVVKSGAKPFELRKDDRPYAVGDVLILEEYEPMGAAYTGEVVRAEVLYCLRGGEWLPPGYVAMGIKLIVEAS